MVGLPCGHVLGDSQASKFESNASCSSRERTCPALTAARLHTRAITLASNSVSNGVSSSSKSSTNTLNAEEGSIPRRMVGTALIINVSGPNGSTSNPKRLKMES